MSLFGIVAGIVAVVISCWFVGRIKLTRRSQELAIAGETLLKFHNELTDFANGGMQDGRLFDDLMQQSFAVRAALGRDNIVSGVTVGPYLFNGVPLLPTALHVLAEDLARGRAGRGAASAVTAMRNVALGSMGRHEHAIKKTVENTRNPFVCIGVGWTSAMRVPLYVLRGFGLISESRVASVSGSFIYRLAAFLAFLATVGGPLLAYMADRQSIEREATRLIELAR